MSIDSPEEPGGFPPEPAFLAGDVEGSSEELGPDPLSKIVITAEELTPAYARSVVATRTEPWPSYGATFAVLWLAATLGSLAIVPYSWTLMKQAKLPPGVPQDALPILVAVQALFEFALSAGAVAVGLWLGESIGMGAPDLRKWLAGDR